MQTGASFSGLNVADLDGDGTAEIICGSGSTENLSRDMNQIPLNDNSGWLSVFSSDLDSICMLIEYDDNKSNASVCLMPTDSTPSIVVYIFKPSV